MLDKHIIRQIKEGRNLEQALPAFLNEMASLNYTYAFANLAMQYYNFYEKVVDGDVRLKAEVGPVLKEVGRILEENLFGSFDGETRERSIAEIGRIRGSITRKMRVLVTYVDIFQLYEYISNRMESKFKGDLADIDDDTVAREIMQYIFMEKDNVVINMKIKEMLSQMPVRMGRGKFCSLVEAGLENYLDEDRSAAEDFIYRIESAAGIYRPEGFEECFPGLAGYYREFAEADWKDMDAKTYGLLAGKLQEAISQVNEVVDSYYGMMEIINNEYVCLLDFPYASADALKTAGQLSGVFRQILDNIGADIYENIPEGLVQEFEKTEEWMEEYSNRIIEYQGIVGNIRKDAEKEIEALALEALCRCLEMSDMLLSGSLFVNLHQEQGAGTGKADAKYLEQKAAALRDRLMEAFHAQQKPLNRAMVAAVLKELPVPFYSQKEVLDYIRESLEGCHDLAEKTASVDLMKDLMEG